MIRKTLHILSILLCLLAAVQNVSAEKKDSCTAGVYITQEDFISNHLSYQVSEKNKENKIEFVFPADMTLILKILEPDTIITFKPGTIYGYYDCGSVYRYSPEIELNVQEDYYKIEEANGLILYSSRFISGSEIFYSFDLNSPIRRLTKKNLEADFKDHPEFITAVKKYCNKFGSDIRDRDNDGAFMINKIYKETAAEGKSNMLIKQASF